MQGEDLILSHYLWLFSFFMLHQSEPRNLFFWPIRILDLTFWPIRMKEFQESMYSRKERNICCALFLVCYWTRILSPADQSEEKECVLSTNQNPGTNPSDQSETWKCSFTPLLADFPRVHSRISAQLGGSLFFTHYSLLQPPFLVKFLYFKEK